MNSFIKHKREIDVLLEPKSSALFNYKLKHF